MPLDKPVGLFIFDYAWIFLIKVTVLNAFTLKARSRRVVREHPEFRNGYDRLFKGYLLYLNIPWVIIGIGMVLGGVPSTFSFFRPRQGNPFVLAFHVSVIILWLLSIRWIYLKGGAEFLAKYRGVFGRNIGSPRFIKIYVGLALFGGIIGMILMWSL